MVYKDFIDKIVLERGHHSNFNKKVKGFEIHHIIPRCLGGNNKSENLVLLTIAEHLMAHTLLVKENPDNKKLLTALYHMSYEIGMEELLKIVDDKDSFERIVKIIACVREARDITGTKNPMYHKHHTEQAKKAMSEKKKGRYKGEENHRWGKHHTEEAKKKISQSRMGKDNWKAKKVYCPELDMIFDTIAAAQAFVGITSGIVQCCNPKYGRKTAGKHPQTKEGLHWVIYE